MLTTEQIQTTKKNWELYYRTLKKKWKGNFDAYLTNKTNLAMDDAIDVVKKKWLSTRFTTQKEHLIDQLFLDENGGLPAEFELHLSMVQALAAEKGIDIRCDYQFEGEDILVVWEVVSIKDYSYVESYQPEKMLHTGHLILKEVEEELKLAA